MPAANDRAYFGRRDSGDHISVLDDILPVFDRTYAAELGKLVEQLRTDGPELAPTAPGLSEAPTPERMEL